MADEKVDFIVIDNNPEVIQKIEDEGFIYVNGCATDDKILIEAGIKRAKGVVCVLPTDADNLYVVLTAKELNPDVYVLSRFEDEASERRLIKAGADRVISPHKVGGEEDDSGSSEACHAGLYGNYGREKEPFTSYGRITGL